MIGRRVRYQSEGGIDLDLSCILFHCLLTVPLLYPVASSPNLWLSLALHYSSFFSTDTVPHTPVITYDSKYDITDRVIAMPIPSERKLTAILKNNINEVTRFVLHQVWL
jgi:hypothetical protein